MQVEVIVFHSIHTHVGPDRTVVHTCVYRGYCFTPGSNQYIGCITFPALACNKFICNIFSISFYLKKNVESKFDPFCFAYLSFCVKIHRWQFHRPSTGSRTLLGIVPTTNLSSGDNMAVSKKLSGDHMFILLRGCC